MKLARYRDRAGLPGFGVVEGDRVRDIGHRVESFEALLGDPSQAAAQPSDTWHELAQITLKPPFGRNPKIFCVGYNYLTHARESGREMPAHPTLFARFPGTFVGAGEPVRRPPESVELDWEGEVALVIGRGGRRIPTEHAAEHIAGFTAMAENSVREWQFHSTQATAGKNWEASGSCGPWLLTADEVSEDPLAVTTRLNGEVVQHDHTGNLAFSFAALIAYTSTFTPLRPGDVIATGTPGGVGFRREPPRFLHDGDVLEVEVSGVGTLRNPVIDEAPARQPARSG